MRLRALLLIVIVSFVASKAQEENQDTAEQAGVPSPGETPSVEQAESAEKPSPETPPPAEKPSPETPPPAEKPSPETPTPAEKPSPETPTPETPPPPPETPPPETPRPETPPPETPPPETPPPETPPPETPPPESPPPETPPPETPPPETPPPVVWAPKTIDHHEVKPFPQPEPLTMADKAGVMFKPRLRITTGCVPYPAVNDLGETSGGLKPTGGSSSNCGGSGHGSQVYGRSTWFRGTWAIMYAWYFPKDSPSPWLGHRHDWECVVVYINNPAVPNPEILGCSPSYHGDFKRYAPCPADVLDGYSVQIEYKHKWPKNHACDITGHKGDFQDLIMWGQMTDFARKALNDSSFEAASVPLNDWIFHKKLEQSWPFSWIPA